ncbi:MAG TPA: hypothetical protein VMH04_12555 [Candidatus Solibacter sp.]|nr:hypothetical protein [Candidatus Solibacter sp.]
MKRISLFATLLITAVALLSTSCGTGDKIGSVSMTVGGTTGTVNLVGLGGTLQLKVTANYTSGKQIDETNFATLTVVPVGVDDTGAALPAPPLGVQIDNTGLITATATDANGDGLCTWINQGTLQTQSWFFTGEYTVTASYRGFTSNPVYIPVASAANNQGALTNGQCGPTS